MKFIPIKINIGFFITSALIGFLNSFSLIGTIIWMVMIFVSVLVHEYGHAITAKIFGQHPRIELIAFGGVTIPEGRKLKTWEEFLVVFMGPFFGFILFVVATLILQLPFHNDFFRSILQIFRFVNLFWTVINLLPILPLDGGQLVRVVLEAFLKHKAWKVSLYISLVASVLFSLLLFLIGFFLAGAVFLIFTFQNLEALRYTRNYCEPDQSECNRIALNEIENLLKLNDYINAIPKLIFLIKKTKEGLIHVAASEYLAKIYFEKREYKNAYDLLNKIEKFISKESKSILYLSAYEMCDYERVVALSGLCFQEKQTIEVAFIAAASNAMLNNLHKSIEWLKRVKSFEKVDLLHLIKDNAFDLIRNEEEFKGFIDRL